jgi:hypothetical protein
MRPTLPVALALVAVLGAVSVAAAGPLAPAAGGQQPAVDGADATIPNASNESNASMGAEVSAFMQASASDANASVDEGMFAAEWNRSTASADELVDRRANALESRLGALQNQKERLLAKEDQLSDVAFTARTSALAARIDALENAINSTSARAQRAGVSATRLGELRANASELSGPEVAAIARNLRVGVGGPPNGTPGSGNGPGGAGPPEGTPGASNNSTSGPPIDDPENGTAQGPSTNDTNGSVIPGDSSRSENETDGGNGESGDGGNGEGGDGGNAPNDLTESDVAALSVEDRRIAGGQ